MLGPSSSRWVCPMIARLDHLRQHPAVFRHLTGVTPAVFDGLAAEVVPAVEAAHRRALDRPVRKRAIGGGDDFDLSTADQLLLTVIWLRQYPTNEALGFLFGVSDSTASRARARCLTALERSGQGTMRVPDPGAARRKRLPALLADTPGLAVVVDSFEQRTQRPKRRQRAYDSGKKKAHPQEPGHGGRGVRPVRGRVGLGPGPVGGRPGAQGVAGAEAVARGRGCVGRLGVRGDRCPARRGCVPASQAAREATPGRRGAV